MQRSARGDGNCACVCVLLHSCAGNILQALTQSPEMLRLRLFSNTHGDWQNKHQAWKKCSFGSQDLLITNTNVTTLVVYPTMFRSVHLQEVGSVTPQLPLPAEAFILEIPGSKTSKTAEFWWHEIVHLPTLQTRCFFLFKSDSVCFTWESFEVSVWNFWCFSFAVLTSLKIKLFSVTLDFDSGTMLNFNYTSNYKSWL